MRTVEPGGVFFFAEMAGKGQEMKRKKMTKSISNGSALFLVRLNLG